MSDPNYSCQPPGGYVLDMDDLCRMMPDAVKCEYPGCGAVISKDDAIRLPGGDWICEEHEQAIRDLEEGRI